MTYFVLLNCCYSYSGKAGNVSPFGVQYGLLAKLE